MFEVLTKDGRSQARLGRLKTEHGDVETPAYVIVGTNAAVRTLRPEDLPATKTQIIIANTYHLWRELGDEGLDNYHGLHAEMEWNGPLMTDSGGFPVFSMGAAREHGVGKITKREAQAPQENLIRVTEVGVYFRGDEEEEYLDAELSIKIQEQLGADIIFAFDEPSSPLHDHAYTQTAMERTHRWAARSLEAKTSSQQLYGIVQGGRFEDLRTQSAKFIATLPFDGFGIGGSFGSSFGGEKTATLRELAWTIPHLPAGKPRHLLGMGRIEDIFAGVEAGIDTFDCVIPTREARHGALWTARGRFDILKGLEAASGEPIDDACACPVCADMGVTRGDLHARFRNKDPEAGRLATIHNVYFFNDLMEKIRAALAQGAFQTFKMHSLKALS